MENTQNQMDNMIQSGVNERENMISDLEKWQAAANELAQALKGLYHMIGCDKKCGYDGLNYRKATNALEAYKKLTETAINQRL